MADDGCEDGNPEDDTRIDVQQEERKVRKAVVNGDFHPVKTHVPDPVEFTNAVMQFVELPQQWDAVEQIVDQELQEILDDEEDQKLLPKGALHEETEGTGHGQKTCPKYAAQVFDKPG